MSFSRPFVKPTRTRIYLDYNATTPVVEDVRTAMMAALELRGESIEYARRSRAAPRGRRDRARRRRGSLRAGQPAEVVFTSGGTEADALGIVGLARLARAAGRPPRVVTTALEHPAVMAPSNTCRGDGFERILLPVDGQGCVDLDGLAAGGADDIALVCLALANHELGTLTDVTRAAAIAHARGALVHCDAVQAAGKVAVDVGALGVDSLALSGHKLHGPKGVGALWVRRGLGLAALFDAGHQERERRPGTENVPGIAGMGVAARLAGAALATEGARVAGLAASLERGLCDVFGDGVVIHGAGSPRVGNTINARFVGALGEAVVAALDLAGFAVSTGAACTSGSVAPSPVLLGIGLPAEHAVEAVRFSLGRSNTQADIQALLEVLPAIIARAKKFDNLSAILPGRLCNLDERALTVPSRQDFAARARDLGRQGRGREPARRRTRRQRRRADRLPVRDGGRP